MMHAPVRPDPELSSRASRLRVESSLADYLHAFWRLRWVLVLGPAVAGIAAYLVALTFEPRFEAIATLLVSPSKTGEQVAPDADVRNFRAFLENQSLAVEIVRQFKLDAPPYQLTPQRFLDRHVTVEQVRGSDLISLSVEMYDPQLAAHVANAMAERAVAFSRSLEQSEAVVARDVIKSQLDASRDRLSQARDALEAYQRTAQVDLLGKKMDVLMDQQADLQQLVVDIQGERAYLQQAERDLAAQDRVRGVQRSVQVTAPPPRPAPPVRESRPEPARPEPRDGTTGERDGERSLEQDRERQREQKPASVPAATPPRPSFRDELIDPYINPSYETLQQDVAAARSRLAQLEHKRDELLKGRSKDGQLPALSEYYKRKAAEDELKMQRELAQKIYLDVATRYEQARLQIANRSAQLQIVDAALTPDRKVFPREKLISFAAAVLTLSVIAGVIVLVTAVSRRLPAEPGDAGAP
jgi:uncharacterized protein involved in exopolysaccharide biosynthesis